MHILLILKNTITVFLEINAIDKLPLGLRQAFWA